MDLLTVNQNIQYIAWFLAIAELIVGLYILVLNPRHSANRYVGIFMIVSAVNTYALGMMVTAGSPGQAHLSAVILAATTSATEPLLLLASVALLRPRWLHGKRRWIWWPVNGLVILPAVFTLIDLVVDTQLWYSGIDPIAYQGGFIITPEFTDGSASMIVRAGFILCFLIITSILLYVTLFDKKSTYQERKLAWILLLQQFLAGAILSYFGQQVILPSVSILLANTIFVVTYAYAAFEQMISARSRQIGSLQLRLTAVVLIVSLPVMMALTAFIVNQAQSILEKNANQRLSNAGENIHAAIMLWVNSHERLLQDITTRPEVISWDAPAQYSLLSHIVKEYPEILSASIIDTNGGEFARGDGQTKANYRGQPWFERAVSGTPITYSIVEGTDANPPALLAAAPISSEAGEIFGVAMFSQDLTRLSQVIGSLDIGNSGNVFVVDTDDRLVAHPKAAQLGGDLEFSTHPAVSMLRQGKLGPFTYTDQDGIGWRVKATLLPNGWGVIAQVPESELLAPLLLFSRLAWFTMASAGVLLVILAVLMIRQTINPIRGLTRVTTAIAAGDLNQVAPVESDDEIGILAQSFNTMTEQIRTFVNELENRVAQRTEDLERRAVQLQVAAEVAREAASIHDIATLLDHTVKLISDKFGFYHAGIFLIDDSREYAVLAAASSEGGCKMLARGHQLKLGKMGIVGHVAAGGEPRIALDVGKEAVYFNNPDLPQTHSEMALPMKAHGLVIGVLDVQSAEPAAFSEEDIGILQVLADQIALAMENTRLIQSRQESILDLENLYKQQIGHAWRDYLEQTSLTYTYDPLGIKRTSRDRVFSQSMGVASDKYEGVSEMTAPILLHGYRIGTLQMVRDKDSPEWSPADQEILDAVMSHLALALESTRILEMERNRSHKDQMLSSITARTQAALDLETVMRRAVREVGMALDAERVQIILGGNGNIRNTAELDKAG